MTKEWSPEMAYGCGGLWIEILRPDDTRCIGRYNETRDVWETEDGTVLTDNDMVAWRDTK